jgi:phosphatidylglycerol:prolipoprotein diacylglycerol transferase
MKFIQSSPDFSIAFIIGGLPIFWYGIIIAGAIMVAFLICSYIFKKRGYIEDIPFELLFILIPLGVLGARLYYVLFSDETFSNFFQIRNGGIAIYGAVIAGGVGLFLYAKYRRKCGFYVLADIVVLGLIAAQVIGRWGNFFNAELYGLEVSRHIPPFTVDIAGSGAHLALFFYESILNLIGFVILLRIFTRTNRTGLTTAIYQIYYGTVRLILEPLRTDDFILHSGSSIHISILIVSLVAAVGIIIAYFASKKIPLNVLIVCLLLVFGVVLLYFGTPVSMMISILSIAFGIVLLYNIHKGKVSDADMTIRQKDVAADTEQQKEV